MSGFLSWWDSAELWLSGRGFVLQTIIVIPVVLGLAYALAVGMDAALGLSIRGLRTVGRRGADFSHADFSDHDPRPDGGSRR